MEEKFTVITHSLIKCVVKTYNNEIDQANSGVRV